MENRPSKAPIREPRSSHRRLFQHHRPISVILRPAMYSSISSERQSPDAFTTGFFAAMRSLPPMIARHLWQEVCCGRVDEQEGRAKVITFEATHTQSSLGGARSLKYIVRYSVVRQIPTRHLRSFFPGLFWGFVMIIVWAFYVGSEH